MKREMRDKMHERLQHRPKLCRRMRRRKLLAAESADYAPERRNRAVQVAKQGKLRWRLAFAELALAVTNVAAAAELGTDEEIQIPGQVKDQMSDRISRFHRPGPELLFGQRFRGF